MLDGKTTAATTLLCSLDLFVGVLSGKGVELSFCFVWFWVFACVFDIFFCSVWHRSLVRLFFFSTPCFLCSPSGLPGQFVMLGSMFCAMDMQLYVSGDGVMLEG